MVTITRERNYPSRAHPGPAWVWLYTVSVPGMVDMKGTGLGWAEQCAKRHANGMPIVKAWLKSAI